MSPRLHPPLAPARYSRDFFFISDMARMPKELKYFAYMFSFNFLAKDTKMATAVLKGGGGGGEESLPRLYKATTTTTAVAGNKKIYNARQDLLSRQRTRKPSQSSSRMEGGAMVG